jgi:MscS family membrane protein
MLKEILDRTELPPSGEIPGDEEVKDEGISEWTIPNTRIKISRVTEGDRAGQFLFSASSVELLDRFYELAKNAPYKSPGRSASRSSCWCSSCWDSYKALVECDPRQGD